MRKMLGLAIAATMVLAVATPAQAVTAKVGAKCTARLAVAKAGTTKVYCGANTNAKTKAKYKLAWIKSVTLYKEDGKSIGCYDLILQNADTQAKAAAAQQQMADIKAQVAKLDTESAKTVNASVAMLQGQIDMLTPLAKSLADNVKQVCP